MQFGVTFHHTMNDIFQMKIYDFSIFYIFSKGPIYVWPLIMVKHRLWVLVRTVSKRWFLQALTIYVLNKKKKKNNEHPGKPHFSIWGLEGSGGWGRG